MVPEMQKHCAEVLLPQSNETNTDPIHVPPVTEPVAAADLSQAGNDAPNSHDDSEDSPLKGIRFPPMTSPSSCDARRERTMDLLSIRRRSIANRHVKLLGIFINRSCWKPATCC